MARQSLDVRLRVTRLGDGSDVRNALTDDQLICWLCDRPFETRIQWHHPVPKSKKGRATVPVHPICHKTIHANFSNAELARIGDSPDILRENPRVAKFIIWVRGKPPDFHAPTRS